MTGIGCELDGMDVDAPFALLFYCKLFNASKLFYKTCRGDHLYKILLSPLTF